MSAQRRLLPLVLGGLLLICLTAFTVWFLTHYERQTERIAIGASAAARRNPFLAAERFLARLGLPVESRAGRDLLRRPPATTDTLVVRDLGRLASEHRAALRAWLAGGGRLLVAAGGPPGESRQDDLLAGFGIGLTEVEDPQGEDPDQALGTFRPAGGGPGLALAFDPDRALTVTAEEALPRVVADGYTRLVQQSVGSGVLTVVSDQRFLTNDWIGRHDHALVLAHLARPAPGGKVWLLYDPAVPGLGALLWRAAPGALAAGGLLILVWAWSLGARLGPLAPPGARARRDLIEHLDAAAAYLWRHGRAAGLTQGTRREVLAAWQRRRPDLRHRPDAEQAAAIAAAAGLSPDAVTAALATAAHDPRTFVEHTRLLQSLGRTVRPPPGPGIAGRRPGPRPPTTPSLRRP